MHLGSRGMHPRAGFGLFGLQLTFVQLLSSARTPGNEPGYVFTIFMLIPLLNPKLTGITEHALLVTVEKVASGHNVVDVGCRGIDAVDQAGELAHGFNLIQCVFHGRITEVIEQLHAVDSQHGRQRIRWSARLALGVISGYLLLQLLPGNQLVHPLQKDLAAGLALLGLVLGFGEGDLIHDGNESYAVDDGGIVADFGDLSRVSLDKSGSSVFEKRAVAKDRERTLSLVDLK